MDRFSVYKHNFTLPSGTLARRQLIVIKHDNGTLTFTNFGKYITSKKAYTSPSNDGNKQFHFVVKMLNFAVQEYGLRSLNNLTIDMVQDFLQNYSYGTLPGDMKPRTKATVEACCNAIMYFLVNYIRDNKGKSALKEAELYRTEVYKDKYNEVRERKVPVFDVICENADKVILRDIPNAAFALILNHIADVHPNLLGLVILSAFVGLRPSEACNVRREDSPLGPGIIFTKTDGEITKIQIDLRQELILRGDGRITGSIKKERLQTVPAIFVPSFVQLYEKYMTYLKNKPYEEEFGAFTVNRQGRAMAYRSYYNTFKKIIHEEMVPIFLASQDEELVEFGRILMEYDLAPHALRHWYSVQLTLAGYGIAELMNARGDKSPESALTYIQNKGELEKKYQQVTEGIFDYFSWAAEVIHNGV